VDINAYAEWPLNRLALAMSNSSLNTVYGGVSAAKVDAGVMEEKGSNLRRIRIVLGLGALCPLAVGRSPVAAQTPAFVTGRITSELGTPLGAASVLIETMAISVSANDDGRYSITIPAARVAGQSVVLRARAIGYVPETRTISIAPGAQTNDFVLRRDVNRLDEVVVTGSVTATTQKKLAYSLTRLDESDMPVTAINPLLQLQGKVAGALVVQPSGRPGVAPAILLRGPKSLAGGGRQQAPCSSSTALY